MARATAVTSIKLTTTADYEAFQSAAGVAIIQQLNPRELLSR